MEYFVSSGRRKSIAEVDVPVRIPFDIDALRWPICIRVYKHLAATTTIEVEMQCLRPPTYLILSPRFNCVPSRTVVNRFESNIFGAKCGDAAQRDRCHDCCLTRFKLKFSERFLIDSLWREGEEFLEFHWDILFFCTAAIDSCHLCFLIN